MSWKLPCQISAHYPRLDDKASIRRIEIGINTSTLINSIKGKSYENIDMIVSMPKQTKATTEIKMV